MPEKDDNPQFSEWVSLQEKRLRENSRELTETQRLQVSEFLFNDPKIKQKFYEEMTAMLMKDVAADQFIKYIQHLLSEGEQ